MRKIATITSKTAGQLRRQACDLRMLLSPRLLAAGMGDAEADACEAAIYLDYAAAKIESRLQAAGASTITRKRK